MLVLVEILVGRRRRRGEGIREIKMEWPMVDVRRKDLGGESGSGRVLLLTSTPERINGQLYL